MSPEAQLSKSEKLEARVGLHIERGLLRSPEARKDPTISVLVRGIKAINSRFASYGIDVISRSEDIRSAAYRLFHEVGPTIWPDDSSTCWWLFDSSNAKYSLLREEYPEDLIYSNQLDREPLWQPFYELICKKYISYCRNHPAPTNQRSTTKSSAINFDLASDNFDKQRHGMSGTQHGAPTAPMNSSQSSMGNKTSQMLGSGQNSSQYYQKQYSTSSNDRIERYSNGQSAAPSPNLTSQRVGPPATASSTPGAGQQDQLNINGKRTAGSDVQVTHPKRPQTTQTTPQAPTIACQRSPSPQSAAARAPQSGSSSFARSDPAPISRDWGKFEGPHDEICSLYTDSTGLCKCSCRLARSSSGTDGLDHAGNARDSDQRDHVDEAACQLDTEDPPGSKSHNSIERQAKCATMAGKSVSQATDDDAGIAEAIRNLITRLDAARYRQATRDSLSDAAGLSSPLPKVSTTQQSIGSVSTGARENSADQPPTALQATTALKSPTFVEGPLTGIWISWYLDGQDESDCQEGIVPLTGVTTRDALFTLVEENVNESGNLDTGDKIIGVKMKRADGQAIGDTGYSVLPIRKAGKNDTWEILINAMAKEGAGEGGLRLWVIVKKDIHGKK